MMTLVSPATRLGSSLNISGQPLWRDAAFMNKLALSFRLLLYKFRVYDYDDWLNRCASTDLPCCRCRICQDQTWSCTESCQKTLPKRNNIENQATMTKQWHNQNFSRNSTMLKFSIWAYFLRNTKYLYNINNYLRIELQK